MPFVAYRSLGFASTSEVELELVDTANRRTNTVELARATIPVY